MYGRYAENTQVSSERSRIDVEKTLKRYGADQFLYGTSNDGAMIVFVANGKRVRFILPMPAKTEDRFWTTPSGRRKRNPEAATEAWEQETRRSWRALALVIKAKLEAVESKITTFEEEFLSHIVLPNDQTVGSWMIPQMERAYAKGLMPALMPRLLTAGTKEKTDADL